jgi:hypothetical protein
VPSFCSVEGGFGEEDMLHVATQGWRCVVFPGASAKFVCELLKIWCSTRTERAWSKRRCREDFGFAWKTPTLFT